jgi:glycosyltransferase involved in cell wall biosynthesis
MSHSSPLRFCMVTTFYPPHNFGGDGLFVHHLVNELANRGHQVEVIHCIESYRMLAGGAEMEELNRHPRVTVHGLRSPFGMLAPLGTHQAGFPVFNSKAIRRILSRGFDVIHYHNVSLVGGPGILMYGDAYKLYTMHEYWLECPTHLLFRFNHSPCFTRHCIACMLTHRRPPQLWRHTPLLRRAARHVDLFLAPSRFMKERFEEGEFRRPVQYLPNFVPAVSQPVSEGSHPAENLGHPYYLFVGRLEKVKGLHTLIPVFRSYPRAKLVVAGSGGYEREVRRLAGDSDNIVFLGQVSQAELVRWYELAVALILPSLSFEVFPLTVLEAFRSATPVVCRNLGSPPRVIEESGGGIAYANDEELRIGLDRLLDDPVERSRLGVSGLAYYKMYCTPEAHLEQYLTFIGELRKAGSSVT